MKKLAVVAFGGNALLRAGQKGTIEEQTANAAEASKKLLTLVKKYNLVLTHGNGPQVGNILLANSAGQKLYGIPEMPMDVCGAYSQGFIGYVLEQQLRNVLMKRNKVRDIITLITQVLVDKNDPAFQNPTKPIGPYYSKEEAEDIMKKTGAVFKEDARGRGWRKVVASPEPLVIFNQKTIEKIAREGHIVITVGGGGIPCYYEAEKTLKGIEAVIDKDLASSRLAIGIRADKFFILTDIAKVFINFNTPQEKAIDKMTILQAEQYLREGQFGEGSMKPKVRAAINFVKNTGKDAIITDTEKLGIDNGGTRITMV
ncbi:carbamate kinase [Candidatus Sulfidibacterium hydrothermale]|uniref:carbamate kinase n=1 Tax=Candidatus Sulfidibacterium hydrothermale TaxID=2875962 RepID=UPI001F0AE287|nr:carbamate kinase [Candidatus Sulfidibacterium hydrothermale]UBM62239.1 carbamate kinase [Candidatus Sulfidibacterium hydrothermale]